MGIPDRGTTHHCRDAAAGSEQERRRGGELQRKLGLTWLNPFGSDESKMLVRNDTANSEKNKTMVILECVVVVVAVEVVLIPQVGVVGTGAGAGVADTMALQLQLQLQLSFPFCHSRQRTKYL